MADAPTKAPAPRPTLTLADAAVRLWQPVIANARKGKLTPPREAEVLLGLDDPDALEQACALLQSWCWQHGLPPIDRAIAFPRTKGPVRVVVDYDVFAMALGYDVHTERVVLGYPWSKVREPAPEHLVRAADAVARHGKLLATWRALDLELDLRERDAARGRRRPLPDGVADWNLVASDHRRLGAELASDGLGLADLRPPGQAPYPPPLPRGPGRDD